MLPPLFSADYLSRLETLRIQTRRRFLGSRPGGHVSLRRGRGSNLRSIAATPPALTSARSWGRMPCVSMALPPQSRRSDERSVIRQLLWGRRVTHPAADASPLQGGDVPPLPSLERIVTHPNRSPLRHVRGETNRPCPMPILLACHPPAQVRTAGNEKFLVARPLPFTTT